MTLYDMVHTSLPGVNLQNALVTPGKGLLAADESIATIGKRFADISIENSQDNRIRYVNLLSI